MGNGLSPCLSSPALGAVAAAKLVYWGGPTRLVTEQWATAGDVTAELPDHLVCPADAFFIGLPVPVLLPSQELLAGRTYFVLPAGRLSCSRALTAASLSSLSPAPARVSVAGSGQCPFEYVKGDDGMALIRILPEFLEKVITCTGKGAGKRCSAMPELCSTPELRKHYMQLVGRRERPWSPALETIPEGGKRRKMWSPVRLVGLHAVSKSSR